MKTIIEQVLVSTETKEPKLVARLRLQGALAEIDESTQSEDHKEKNKAIAVMNSLKNATNMVFTNSIAECHNYEKFLKPTLNKSTKLVPSASIGEMHHVPESYFVFQQAEVVQRSTSKKIRFPEIIKDIFFEVGLEFKNVKVVLMVANGNQKL